MYLTIKQIRDFVRVDTGHTNSKDFGNKLLDQYIKFAVSKIQGDLQATGYKNFKKTVYYPDDPDKGASANIFELPSDIIGVPNCIENIYIGYGSKATWSSSFTGTHNDVVITLREPGANNGGTEGVGNILDCTNPGSPPVGTIQWAWTGVLDFNVWVNPGVTTANELITYLQADVIFNHFFEIRLADGNNGSGVIDITNMPLTTTVGSRWKLAREIDNKDWGNIDWINQGTELNPVYRFLGDDTGRKIIQVYPYESAYTYIKVEYYYELASFTSDTDTIDIPTAMQELIVIDVKKRMFQKLKDNNEVNMMKIEYEQKLSEFTDRYIDKRIKEIEEKTRIKTADVQK